MLADRPELMDCGEWLAKMQGITMQKSFRLKLVYDDIASQTNAVVLQNLLLEHIAHHEAYEQYVKKHFMYQTDD